MTAEALRGMRVGSLPVHLTALIEQARVAHQPSAADAQRVGAALSAIIPGFVPVALLGPCAQGAR